MYTKERFFTLFCNDKGYALPTVLLISMIIIALTMGMTSSVRSKVETAIELKARTSAYLKSHSAMSEVVYNILTSTFTSTGIKIRQEDGSQLEWNLYADPIELSEGVTVRLRDSSGMLSLLFHRDYLRELMEYASQDSKKSNAFADALADWQDIDDFKRLNGAESFDYRMAGYSYAPRNFYIQVPQEVMLLKGFDADLFEEIKDELVYWGGGHINYLTMSEKLLRALLKNDPLVDRIIQLRKEGKLTGRVFRSLTAIPLTEETFFAPSGWIKVVIRAQVEKAVDRIEAVVVKRQLRKRPYMVTEWRR